MELVATYGDLAIEKLPSGSFRYRSGDGTPPGSSSWGELVGLHVAVMRSKELADKRAETFGAWSLRVMGSTAAEKQLRGQIASLAKGWAYLAPFGTRPEPAVIEKFAEYLEALQVEGSDGGPFSYQHLRIDGLELAVGVEGVSFIAEKGATDGTPEMTAEQLLMMTCLILSDGRSGQVGEVEIWDEESGENIQVFPSHAPFLRFVVERCCDLKLETNPTPAMDPEQVANPQTGEGDTVPGQSTKGALSPSATLAPNATSAGEPWSAEWADAQLDDILRRHNL